MSKAVSKAACLESLDLGVSDSNPSPIVTAEQVQVYLQSMSTRGHSDYWRSTGLERKAGRCFVAFLMFLLLRQFGL